MEQRQAYPSDKVKESSHEMKDEYLKGCRFKGMQSMHYIRYMNDFIGHGRVVFKIVVNYEA